MWGRHTISIPEVPDVDLTKSKRINHPLILRVAIAVFVGPQSVGHAFDGIDDWAGKVICWVDLPLVTGGREMGEED
jgi:hypothetical protein